MLKTRLSIYFFYFYLAQTDEMLPKFCFLGPELIKPFSCSTQLSMKFQLLIKTKIQMKTFLALNLWCYIYHANQC